MASEAGPTTSGNRLKLRWRTWIILVFVGILIWFAGGLYHLFQRDKDMFNPAAITQLALNKLKDDLVDFRNRCGVYPTTEQGLIALARKPNGLSCPRYTADEPDALISRGPMKDDWGVPFKYESDGKHYRVEALTSRLSGPGF